MIFPYGSNYQIYTFIQFEVTHIPRSAYSTHNQNVHFNPDPATDQPRKYQKRSDYQQLKES